MIGRNAVPKMKRLNLNLLTASLLVIVATWHSRPASGGPATQDLGMTKIPSFQSRGEPLLPTLLKIAKEFHVPMGIERVTEESLRQPVAITFASGTLSGLLDDCMRQAGGGYRWRAAEGTVHIFGEPEVSDPTNLFNHIIPFFKVEKQTISSIDLKLSMLVLQTKQERPGGVIGSYLGEPGGKLMTMEIRNATVREILNRMVMLEGERVWISRASPHRLSELPQRGLWQLLPIGRIPAADQLKLLLEIPRN